MTHLRSSLGWIALFMPLSMTFCADESYPQAEWRTRNRGWVNTQVPDASVPTDASMDRAVADAAAEIPPPRVDAASDAPSETSGPIAGAACTSPVRASEALPARLAVTSSSITKASRPYFVNDLFRLFETNCGGCHVQGSSGGFNTLGPDFADKVDRQSIDRIRADQPLLTMPPISSGGKLASQRTPGDPVLELAGLLQLWIEAGRPRDVFDIKNNAPSGANPYLMGAEAADNLSNLGSCIPAKRIVSSDFGKMDQVDAMFASLKRAPEGTGSLTERVGLPERLDQTDLSTFDTEALARQGVIAFVPGYPLWSDGSGKLRHVRVPKGQSIRFDPKTQSFDIPPNTRFYKTFLKKIVDIDGVISYRKIETRIIVARPDIDHPNAVSENTALYGAYAWNEDETEATLVTDPLRNGEPFRDRLLTYVTDEPLAKYIRDQKPNNLTLALERANAVRRYAIPGRERCVQCHMGSPMKNFVLGFLPVQIDRRPHGESGVIDTTGVDELSQFHRLIDYGVISGATSPAEVLPLEKLEGNRKPRTEQELVAQGYMLGNCAHCHNPRGFPSVTAPVLADLLDFLPGPNGGIFEFPLERTSPRIFRGLNNDVPIPYITPSIMDIALTAGGKPKWDFVPFGETGELQFRYALIAPWRSLIYRNVDTPFTYADDNALYPHMPMNVAGFDCRAPQILGDWMISIPAIWKNPTTYEFAAPKPGEEKEKSVPPGARYDPSPQPYAEVKPGDPDYGLAVADAKHRANLFRSGEMDNPSATSYSRYDYCPDSSDIIDREVLRNPKRSSVPIDEVIADTTTTPVTTKMPVDQVPDRPHWVVMDATEVRGDWNPRRSDWKTVLVDRQFPPVKPEDFPFPADFELAKQKQQREMAIVDMLQTMKLDSVESYLAQPIPLGLWQAKSSCTFNGEKKISDFPVDQRQSWMDGVAGDSAVYSVLPGEAVYGMICINCHGTNFDSFGRQADNLALMTGGNARVANFRTGLFGTTDASGSNRVRVFGPQAPSGVSADDLGARYMGWMALGGTAQTIPPALLAVVANSDVLGVRRSWTVPPASANMLDTAKVLCSSLLGFPDREVKIEMDERNLARKPNPAGMKGHITGNGDATLWMKVCSVGNRAPLRAVWPKANETVDQITSWQVRIGSDLYPTDKYPSDAPVIDHRGHVVNGVDASNNFLPWCIRKPLSAARLALVDKELEKIRLPDGSRPPYCPTAVVPAVDENPGQDGHFFVIEGDDINSLWGTHGALNAGFAVFRFLKAVTQEGYKPKPRHDRCDLLSP